jgi:hypothetical protein
MAERTGTHVQGETIKAGFRSQADIVRPVLQFVGVGVADHVVNIDYMCVMMR